MWRLIFLVSVCHLWDASSRPFDTMEIPIWIDVLEQSEDKHSKNIQADIFRNLRDSLYYDDPKSSEDNNELSDSSGIPTEKRALSMIARWGAVNSIGKDRHPIRSGYQAESISTQTRSRMLGQPLRWGTSLDCIACNVTKENNNCKSVHVKTSCQGSSVCLSSTYEVTLGSASKTYITKSCFMKNGEECKTFLKNQQVQFGDSKVRQVNCYTCTENDCNMPDNGSSSIGFVSMAVLLLSYIVTTTLV